MLVNKQAFFSVRFARNLMKKTPAERSVILDQLSSKARSLVSAAITAISNKEKKANGL